MATLTATQIYQVCIQAGFPPDAAVTWTAIAMAESGGNSDAHNGNANTGDNSYGLFQINMLGDLGPARRAQYGIATNEELFDPVTNARAALRISNNGTNMQPWSVTHENADGTARYEQYLDDAQAAAAAAGEGPFDLPTAAGPTPAVAPVEPAGPSQTEGPDTDADGAPDAFEMSHGTDPLRPDSDLDGLTDGFELAMGSNALAEDTDMDGLGDALEARLGTSATMVDTDGDGMTDALEVEAGRDALHGIAWGEVAQFGAGPAADTDSDGLSDAMETAAGTNANLADTDGDGITDDMERVIGTSALDPDSNDDGLLDSMEDADAAGPMMGAGPRPFATAGPMGTPIDMPWATQPAGADAAGGPGGLVMPDQPAAEDSNLVRSFLDHALAQTGDEYIFGSETDIADDNPEVFDCSELVQWAGGQVGLEVPDGSWIQYNWLKEQGLVIPVEEAANTPGALLFSFSSDPGAGGRPSAAHVAISLGDGNTIEARGRRYGVGSWEVGDRFNYAAVLPGFDASGVTPGAGDAGGGVDTLAPPETTDHDADGLEDAFEMSAGTDPNLADTDLDGLTDGFEHHLGLNAILLDSDTDGLSDGYEARIGLNPLYVDTDADGLRDDLERVGVETLPDTGGPIQYDIDSDGDGLMDSVEATLGTNANLLDSDFDGLSDDLEYASHAGPVDLTLDDDDPGLIDDPLNP
jgi:cell wall-associated NlpC family hydrolase